MYPLSFRTHVTLFVALVLPAALSVWLMVVPTFMTLSTYAAVTTLLIGVAAVTLHSANNARPTGSLGQLLYETERNDSTNIFERRR